MDVLAVWICLVALQQLPSHPHDPAMSGLSRHQGDQRFRRRVFGGSLIPFLEHNT